MNLGLDLKTAIVTGGTGGIGYAIAEVLAREGARVVVTGRTKKSVEKAVGAIKATNPTGEVQGVVADLGTVGGTQTLIHQVESTDILVNNLGIYEAKPFAEITDADWVRLFEVNVLSGVRTARAYLPGMMARNSGRIIFISSESALMVPSDMIHYGMTKTAQLAISRGLAETTKGSRVTVNAVLPGPTRSEGIVEFIRSVIVEPEAGDSESERLFFKKHRTSSLLQRLLNANEIASLVAYLASPLSSATNGAALRAEGGIVRSIA